MLQLIERGFFKSEPIKLSASTPGGNNNLFPDVQVLRVGKFNHPKYGEFEITPLVLQELKLNFDNKIRGVDIAIDYFHESDKEAAGWIKEMYLSENDSELWAKVDWTPNANRKLAEREIRYFSPDFAFKWTDPENGKEYSNVLFGGGLTNRPFVKDMAAIVAAEQKEEEMKLEELTAKVVKLAEDGDALKKQHDELKQKHEALMAEHEALKAKVGEKPAEEKPAEEAPAQDDENDPAKLKEKIAVMQKQLEEYAAKEKQSAEAAKLAEKKAAFQLLLTEGKACVAQEKAFLEGDMTTFIKLSQPLNLEGKGHSSSETNGGNTAEGDREDRVLKLAEEKCKADPKLGMVEAIKLANKEVK